MLTQDLHECGQYPKGGLSHRYDDNDRLVLVGKTEPVAITADLSPSPYTQLIQDPGFLLNCTFLNMAIPTVAGIQLFKEGSIGDEFSTLFGRAKIDIEEQEFPFGIRPINIGKGESALKLKPSWGTKSIRFDIQSRNGV